MLHFLAIDGGGVMGVGVARYLHLLSIRNSISSTNDFDGFAGTSTGSIIASALAVGKSEYSILSLYKQLSKKIFKDKNIVPFSHKYHNKKLKNLLKMHFGEILLSEVDKPLYIGYYDYYDNEPKVFDRVNDGHIKLADAILISCSAPTYFKPIKRRYADGGTLLQNPALVGAFLFSLETKTPKEKIAVLSMGTNGYATKDKKLLNRNMLLWDWIPKIIDTSITGSEKGIDFLCRLSNFGKYLRIEPLLDKNYKMDDPNIIEEYENIWEQLFSSTNEETYNFIYGDKSHESTRV